MKIFVSYIFCFLFFNIAYSQYLNFYDIDWHITSSDKAVYYSTISQKDGKWFLRYYNMLGKIKSEGVVKNLDTLSYDGLYISYYDNGGIESQQHFSNGLKIGKHLWFYQNGNLHAEINFFNDKKNGIQQEYFSNGKINYKMFFVNDTANGPITYFYENGKKKIEGTLRNNYKVGEWIYYDTNEVVLKKEIYQKEFFFNESKLKITFHDNVWFLQDTVKSENFIKYVFKRIPIHDTIDKKNVIPFFSVQFIDIPLYFTISDIIKNDIENTVVKIDTMYKIEDVILPDLNYPYLVFQQNYHDKNNINFSSTILYAINPNLNKGIIFFFSITKSLFPYYKNEFIEILKSIKEL
jgi:antitoxin component YwqK of YwqJK toxin-antitoxin module